jgi:hypothetical protein
MARNTWQFRDGAPNGKGTITHPDGESYTGSFKDGKKSVCAEPKSARITI